VALGLVKVALGQNKYLALVLFLGHPSIAEKTKSRIRILADLLAIYSLNIAKLILAHLC
jgi:hypothetical protein